MGANGPIFPKRRDQQNLWRQTLETENLSNSSVRQPRVEWVEDTSNNKGKVITDEQLTGWFDQLPQPQPNPDSSINKEPDLFKMLWGSPPNRPDTSNKRYSVARQRKASLVVASKDVDEGLVSTKRAAADEILRLLKRLRAENQSSNPVEDKDSQDSPLTQSYSSKEMGGLASSGEGLAWSEEGAVLSGGEFTPGLDEIISETDEEELEARQKERGVSFASATLCRIVSNYTCRPPHYFESDDPEDPIEDSEDESSENEESVYCSVEFGAFIPLDFENDDPEDPIEDSEDESNENKASENEESEDEESVYCFVESGAVVPLDFENDDPTEPSEPTILQTGEDNSDANAYLLNIPIGDGDVDKEHKADILSKIDSFRSVLDKNLNRGLRTEEAIQPEKQEIEMEEATKTKKHKWHHLFFLNNGTIRRTDHDSSAGYTYSDFVRIKQ